jgi:hypothetical protein
LQRELDQDVDILKGIMYDTVEKSILFQRQAKEEMSVVKGSKRAALKAIIEAADVQDLIFFDPKQFIQKCFDKDKSVDLSKLREVRAVFTKLAINLDKLTLSFLGCPDMSLHRQVRILIHLFDGVGKYAREERENLKKLCRKLVHMPGKSSASLMVEGLSKARILCMFYVKWLTIADNEYTDNNVDKADMKRKREFGSQLERKLVAISNAELSAVVENISTKLERIEKTMKTHAAETKLDHSLMRQDILMLEEACIYIAKKYQNETLAFIESNKEEIKTLFMNVQTVLQNKDLSQSHSAQAMKEKLEKGIGISADLIQIISFLAGITSLPALLGTPLARQGFDLIRRFVQKLR